MTMLIYSYYNKLKSRFENVFLAETDAEIIDSIERAATDESHPQNAKILRDKLESVDLVRIGRINLTDGTITQEEKKKLPIVINPVRPIDGIEKTVIENAK